MGLCGQILLAGIALQKYRAKYMVIKGSIVFSQSGANSPTSQICPNDIHLSQHIHPPPFY